MVTLSVWGEACAFIRRKVSPIPARYVAAGFRNGMRKKLEKRNEKRIRRENKGHGNRNTIHNYRYSIFCVDDRMVNI